MITFDLEEMIQRPVKVVWSFLNNTGNERQWQPATLVQRYTSPEPYGVGSVGLNARRVMGKRVETTWEITEYTPERSFTSKSTSGPISYTISYTLEEVNSSTHLSLHFQGDPKGLFKVAEPLLASAVKKEFVEDHVRLKVLLEKQTS